MKVAFDYLRGPVLGHKIRCEVLQKQLVSNGHEIVDESDDYDWLIVDYPPNTLTVLNQATNKRLLMGMAPYYSNDYSWHPLGPITNRTLHGIQYIIVDPELRQYVSPESRDGILITCGGADPFYTTEKLIELLAHEINVDIIIGPNFGRDIRAPHNCLCYHTLSHSGMAQIMSGYKTVIATWGNTVFEGLALGCRVIPITTKLDHPGEAKNLGVPYIKSECLYDYTIARALATTPYDNYGIDFLGAQRVVEFIEKML